MKRYTQILTIDSDRKLIEKYIDIHRHVWPEIIEGQHQVGILSMQIFAKGNILFMIVDTVDDFDWKRDMLRLSELPRQAEWEAYVAQYQGCSPSARSDEKWQMMEKIFDSEE